MATTRNYGTRTLTLETKNPTKKPIYLTSIRDGQCYCAECQKTFTSKAISDLAKQKGEWDVRNIFRGDYSSPIKSISATASLTENDIECPECHQKGEYSFPNGNGRMSSSRERAKDEKHIDFSNAKYIDDTITGRYIYESRNGEQLTKLEDNIMTENATVFPTGKSFHEQKEISITYDLAKKQIQNSTVYIHNGERINGPIVDSVDPFMNNPKFKRTQRRLSSSNRDNYGMHKYVYSTLAEPSREDTRNLETKRNMLFDQTTSLPYTTRDGGEAYAKINDHIIRQLAGAIEHKDPMFEDPFNTKLFLKEHKQDSTRENTEENSSIKYYYATLAVKYPGVLQYIEVSALNEIENKKYAMARKNETSVDEQIIPDSAKAKIYREHFTKIASQLEAIDDKITASLSKCKTAEEVIETCQGFAFGNKEFKDKQAENGKTSGSIPFALRKVDAKTFDDGKGTKSHYSAFKQNPLGVANTLYTLRKIGITEENAINDVLEMTGWDKTKGVFADGSKNRNKSDKKRHYENFMMDFNTIAPIRSREMMSYFKCFAQQRDIKVLIDDVYAMHDDTQHHQMFLFDGIQGYKNLMESKVEFNKVGKNKINAKKEDEDITESTYMKNAMKTYFKNGFSVKDAYIAYADVFGKDTYDIVNSYARRIQKENAINEMRRDYDKYADENRLSLGYPSDDQRLVEYMSGKYPNIKTVDDIKQLVEEADKIEAETTIIDTRNGKPLFNKRTVEEIHNEINNMQKQIPKTNETLVFKHNELALEGTYDGFTEKPAENTELTPAQEEESHNSLTFEVLPDRFSYIRTSTALHNCLISCDYFSKTKRGSCTIVAAKDENKKIVGCIELTANRDHDGYTLQQFQTDHDDAMPERFRQAALKWFEANNITYERCHDYERWGKQEHPSTRDYHHEEMDEAYAIPVSISELHTRQKNREEAAKNIYGVDAFGNISVPEAPDDLREFS